jgi:predicted Fe-Mo cluster-binding NifX family protein
MKNNPYKNASSGAGPSAEHFLAQKGVTMVIAGNFGPTMVHGLKNNKVTHLLFEGTVCDALKKALEGRQ